MIVIFLLKAVELQLLFLLSALWWMRIRGCCASFLMERTDCGGKLDLALVFWAMLSKTLIQLSANRWDCTPSLLVVWPEVTQSWSLQAPKVKCYSFSHV